MGRADPLHAGRGHGPTCTLPRSTPKPPRSPPRPPDHGQPRYTRFHTTLTDAILREATAAMGSGPWFVRTSPCRISSARRAAFLQVVVGLYHGSTCGMSSWVHLVDGDVQDASCRYSGASPKPADARQSRWRRRDVSSIVLHLGTGRLLSLGKADHQYGSSCRHVALGVLLGPGWR